MAFPAFGEEHVVIVTGFAFFPEVIHVEPGDTILFVNKSGGDQMVVAADGSWTIGPLQNEAEAALVVEETTTLRYQGHKTTGATAPMRAEISFGPAPLG